MATITKDTADQVAAIIGDTLNGWFQPNLHFGPIIVRQLHDDWYGEDYLHVYIVWEGDRSYIDHSRTIGLPLDIRPQLDAIGIAPDLDLHHMYVEKWDWDLNHERVLKCIHPN